MKCPFCSKQLKQVKSKSAVVDVCPDCGGIWFDSGELADFANALSQSEKITARGRKSLEQKKGKSLFKINEKVRVCPKCNTELSKFNYASDSNIILDKCTGCGGIWADGGEVQHVAGYLKEDPRTTAVGRNIAELTLAFDASDSDESALSYFMFFPRFVIPLSDDIPYERFPFATVSLIALCVLAFLGQVFLVTDIESFVKNFGFVPARFFGVGLLSSMFLHGSFLHLFGNMLFLWIFGDNVEDRFSRRGYVIFCLCGGLCASILHGIFNPGSVVPVVGASGFISAVMGAYLVFYPEANITLLCFYRTIEVPVVMYLGGWFFLQLTASFLFKDAYVSNVAWFAHIGGFAFGAVVAFFKKRAVSIIEEVR
ncbi:MAG: rhomboid family intramembrane serine protease [Planctomycetes bacterium]|nr:rhomboid family intramembrane serine protease [Planctomycetota bacterium]